MNWDAIAAVAELLGAIAVIGTLAYLAMQIRQSNISARIAARLEMTRQHSDFTDGLLNNPESFRIFGAGLANELSNEDQAYFDSLMHKCVWFFSAHHLQYVSYSLSDDEWYQSKMLMHRVANNGGVQSWWLLNKQYYAPSFVEFFDKEIIEGDV